MCRRFMLLLTLLFVSVNAFATDPLGGMAPLPQTGQTTCYDESGGLIDCAGTGQDGEYQAGVPWPAVRLVPNFDGTVTDLLTGLVWTEDANAPGPEECGPGTQKSFQGALDYAACLNRNSYLGYTDWRVPNIHELKSLLNYSDPLGSSWWLTTQGLQNLQIYPYWSSTTNEHYPGYAYRVTFDYGDYISVSSVEKIYDFIAVWPVRSSQMVTAVAPLPQTGQTFCFDENGTVIDCVGTGQDGEYQIGVPLQQPRFLTDVPSVGTITDNMTGLIWLREPFGSVQAECAQFDYTFGGTWLQNFDFIACLNRNNYRGFNDWRMPNVVELDSLVNYSQPYSVHEYLRQNGFWSDWYSGIPYFWTSTTGFAFPDGVVWIVDSYTDVSPYPWINFMWGKQGAGVVLPVRGGRPGFDATAPLQVSTSGAGMVTTNYGPLRWNGNSATAEYSLNVPVTLTAEPETGYFFTGWNGACTGTTSCTVIMDNFKEVSASFAPLPVTLLAPNGGESFNEGASTTVSWSPVVGAQYYSLSYSLDGGSSWVFFKRVGSVASSAWKLPEVANDQESCLVRVTALDGSLKLLSRDQSDSVFTIVNKVPVTLLTPNGGESFNEGTTTTVSWSPVVGAQYYSLSYSLDGGSSWVFFKRVGSVTSSAWTLPEVANDQESCLVRVTALDGSLKLLSRDQSDSVFTILAP